MPTLLRYSVCRQWALPSLSFKHSLMIQANKFILPIMLIGISALLSSCGISNTGKYYDRDGPPVIGGKWRAVTADKVDVKVEKPHKWANRPYTVMGKRYYPMSGDKPLTQTGTASWYGKQFHGKKTSTGEIYDMYELSAAHPTMELPSYAKVTNLKNGRSIIVRVNDRGPFLHGRIIDLSYAAAVKLGYQKEGTTRVRVERITRADIARGKIPSTGTVGAVLASVASGLRSMSEDSKPQTVSKETSQQSRTITVAPTKTEPLVSSTSVETNVSRETTDTVGAVIDQTADHGAPAVSMSFSIENTVSNGVEIPVSEKETAIVEMTSDKHPPSETNEKATSVQDAIQAVLSAEQQKIETIASSNTPNIDSAWTVQIGAYTLLDNAQAGAAHAENILSQESISPVNVVKSGDVYKIWAGRASSRDEASVLAKKITDKLGIKAIPVTNKPNH